ncbi:MAG: proline/glycine betaine ABC transporter permease [Gammaproteobacteria bacterium]|nr:proline/glycine betaine ABC transporter permease [Gammaproteobacteria bacterium]NIR82632.1 proline/glycine betaine ABC transporter permease [Gammaproteobacteria bacterium]NIR89095.1 proline/glycine betaine ABC transporter permease [Gammaproteobacteria bacterium]NIU03791.1 proline/glycine betaine ABC transporter permease [Gammaproteobacteria bacterium]NIV51128.1 ABC transporter permease subunit [Gammaproteobacteria bacterium]
MFPESLSWPLGDWINAFVEWLVVDYGDYFEAAANALLFVLVKVEQFLRGMPWWIVLLAVAATAYHASRSIKLTGGMAGAMVLIGSLGLWDLAMQTLALMLIATSISVVIGIPIGILLSRSDRVRTIVLPLLDLMQTMPSFVYLIPALMLFGLGKVPAIVATVIYAVPPLIRLTDLGIRLVDTEVIEASKAFGASRRQLLFGVQIPLALPNIMQGVNQTTMMALAMVVIASMIGARGLGEQVLLGIQRLDVGQGAEAGVGIVALAIVLDRVSQAYGKRSQAHRIEQEEG